MIMLLRVFQVTVIYCGQPLRSLEFVIGLSPPQTFKGVNHVQKINRTEIPRTLYMKCTVIIKALCLKLGVEIIKEI